MSTNTTKAQRRDAARAEALAAATEAAGNDESLAAADGTFGTPAVLIDGERFDGWRDPGALVEAITDSE